MISDSFQISYTKNEANVALYRNLNTTEFTFDSTSLAIQEVQDLV